MAQDPIEELQERFYEIQDRAWGVTDSATLENILQEALTLIDALDAIRRARPFPRRGPDRILDDWAATYRYFASWTLRKLGRIDEAIEMARESLAADESRFETWDLLIELLLGAERTEEAIAQMQAIPHTIRSRREDTFGAFVLCACSHLGRYVRRIPAEVLYDAIEAASMYGPFKLQCNLPTVPPRTVTVECTPAQGGK